MGRGRFPGDWTPGQAWEYGFLKVDMGSLAGKITEVSTQDSGAAGIQVWAPCMLGIRPK